MNKYVIPLAAALLSVLFVCSCSAPYTKYQTVYTDYFDVNTIIIAYAQSQRVFDKSSQAICEVIENDGKYFDIYNDYEGINNLKTVNDNAGIAPVSVDAPILDLLEFSFEAYELTGGTVNISMGPVLSLWHEYRTQGNLDMESAVLPPLEALRALAENTDIRNVIIDREAGTVFLAQSGMSLDVGALAKGFTAQRALEAAKKTGLESVLINMGGNIVSYGKPMDGRDRWAIGIHNPWLENGVRGLLDTVYANNLSAVSSGDYQRFYTVGGQKYHHIIDPETLMPARRYTHVTVLHADSGMADALSTAVFILPQQEGRTLLEQNKAEGMWLYPDGRIEATQGYTSISQKLGDYTAVDP